MSKYLAFKTKSEEFQFHSSVGLLPWLALTLNHRDNKHSSTKDYPSEANKNCRSQAKYTRGEVRENELKEDSRKISKEM